MKAEKVLGIVACAVACVASVNAFAEQIDWFDGKVSTTESGIISTPEGASWNTTLPTGVTPADGSITLDNDSATALVLTPSGSEPTLSDKVVTISSTAVLTPSDASDLGDVDGAKAGFAVGVSNDGADTNFYGYASGLASGSRWVKLSGTVPQGENATTTFSIVLDYRTGKKNVKFYFEDTQLTAAGDSTVKEWAIDSEAAALANVSAYGSGSLSALSATCEKAVAALVSGNGATTNKYGSVVEALKDQQSGDTVADIVAATGEASSTPLAQNGLYVWQCDVLGVAPNANIPFKPAAAVNNNITLQVASEIESGIQATFKVYTKSGDNWVEGNAEYPSNAIQLPTEASGKYQIKPAAITAQ